MSRTRLVIGCLAAVALGTSCAAAAEQPQDAGPAVEVKKLFQAGWERTQESRRQAEQQYERLGRLAPADSRIPYAYALVQLRQYRYAEAAKLLDQSLRRDKSNLAAGKLRIWLAVLTKQYNQALVQMRGLAELLGDKDAAADPRRADDLPAFLGRICGYLAGPVRPQVSQPALTACQGRILARLASPEKTAFEQARQHVLDQFSGAAEAVELSATEAQLLAAKRKDRVLDELDRKLQQAEAQAAEQRARAAKRQEQLKYEIENLTAEAEKINNTRAQLQNHLITLREEFDILSVRIEQLLVQAEAEQQGERRQRLLDEAARQRTERRRILARMAEMERRLADLLATGAKVQNQRNVLAVEMQKLSRDAAQARAALERLRAERDKAAGESIAGDTPGVRDQKRRAAALTTYVPLPLLLEDEMKRLLESFQ